tara:strand:+ start:95 stop:511 length:417 start_codon:yes stop_codon:yes gene_type:complete
MSDDTVSKLLESLSDEQKSELIQTILNSNVKSDEPPAEQEETKSPEGEREEGLFVMNKGSGQVDNKTPATGGNRFNKFRDDGDEHKDEQNETPSASLTERRRSKFKKVEQICQRCKTTLEIHPQFARDFFVCDQCLKR